MSKAIRPCLMIAVAFALAAPLLAQESAPRSAGVEERLLEILRSRGIIKDEEFEELSELGRKLREEEGRREGIEEAVEGRIDTMVSRLAQKSAVDVGYKVGSGFTFTHDVFALTIGGRLQTRFTYTDFESDDEPERDDLSDFSVQRARLWFKGHAFAKYIKFEIQFDAAGSSSRGTTGSSTVPEVSGSSHSHSFTSDNRSAVLKDGFIDLDIWAAAGAEPLGKVSPINLKVGQFKAPFSRQQLTSSGRQQFVDRAITDRQFVKGREPGAMLYGMFGGAKDDLIEWYAGVFNGEGENVQNNDPGLEVVGRVAINFFGAFPYSESDTEDTTDPLLQIAAGILQHEDRNRATGSPTSGTTPIQDEFTWNAELAFRWAGLYAAFEWFDQEFGVDEFSGSSTDLDQEQHGFYAQAGYFIVPKSLELGLRYAEIDFETGSMEERREILGVVGWFLEGHNLKLQSDFGHVRDKFDDGSEDEEWRFRLQLQLIF